MLEKTFYFDLLYDDGNGFASIAENVDTMTVTTEKGTPYTIVEFSAQNVPFRQSHVRDGERRIELRLREDSGETITIRALVDSLKQKGNNRVKVVAKTAGALLSEEYSYRHTVRFEGDTGQVLVQILEVVGLAADISGYTSFELPGGGYAAEDISLGAMVDDILSITMAEILHDPSSGNDGTIVIRNAQAIEKDDTPSASFNSIDDIEAFDTSSNTEGMLIDTVYVNQESKRSELIEPSLVLEIDQSPQPYSPVSVLKFIDDETKEEYRIGPVSTWVRIYFSPQGVDPKISISDPEIVFTKNTRLVFEEYEVGRDQSIKARGEIHRVEGLTVSGVECVEDYDYEIAGGNAIVFKREHTGHARLLYETDIYEAILPADDRPGRSIEFQVTHEDREIRYLHKYEYDGYWPSPYTHTFDLVNDWSFRYDDISNTTVGLYRITGKDTSEFVGNITSSSTGLLDVQMGEYGIYMLTHTGYEPLYVEYYVNKFDYGYTKLYPIPDNEV